LIRCLRQRRSASRTRGGFTLVEVAVTVAIVAICLTLAIQTLSLATLRAGHTRNLKTARELGSFTLGQIEAGLFWEDIDSGISGTYSEQSFELFYYEIVIGDETFPESAERQDNRPHDMWAHQEEQRRQRDDYDPEEEDARQPYEKVRIKVTFPALREYPDHLLLERWIPWDQVYGPEEDEGSNDGESSSEGR
jgi:prepilin-type N-terminal cleavage/methylation domain-containing protein